MAHTHNYDLHQKVMFLSALDCAKTIGQINTKLCGRTQYGSAKKPLNCRVGGPDQEVDPGITSHFI